MAHFVDRAVERHGIKSSIEDTWLLIEQIRNQTAILINGSKRHTLNPRQRDYFMFCAHSKQYIPVIFDFDIKKVVTTLPHHKWLRKQMHLLNKNFSSAKNRCKQCENHFAQFNKSKKGK